MKTFSSMTEFYSVAQLTSCDEAAAYGDRDRWRYRYRKGGVSRAVATDSSVVLGGRRTRVLQGLPTSVENAEPEGG